MSHPGCVRYNYKDRRVRQTQAVFDSLFYHYNLWTIWLSQNLICKLETTPTPNSSIFCNLGDIKTCETYVTLQSLILRVLNLYMISDLTKTFSSCSSNIFCAMSFIIKTIWKFCSSFGLVMVIMYESQTYWSHNTVHKCTYLLHGKYYLCVINYKNGDNIKLCGYIHQIPSMPSLLNCLLEHIIRKIQVNEMGLETNGTSASSLYWLY